MIRDITLGQYYQTESWVHRLDPRLKIIATLLYIVVLFVVDDFLGFAIAYAGMETVIILSKVPRRFILKGLKPVFLIIAFTLVINLFMIQGEVLVQFWKFHITREGVHMAAFMGIRLFLLIIGSSLLTSLLLASVSALSRRFIALMFALPASARTNVRYA